MFKIESLSKRELSEDIYSMLEMTEIAMEEKNYEKALIIKEKLFDRLIYLDNLDYENLGTYSFKKYCIAINRAIDKSGLKWQEHSKDPYKHYIYKLDEIRIELDYYIAFS
ncbi:hypothetical protein J3T78_02245 [Staphylococcus nepalensis]|uniref:Uncharacterized protein n=1 Tax=Staphylococcus nepalensis TaxID=214473 RepID=A0ABS3L5E4_9STAP|nr:hypothetical protein [Staphylococcus nepalensis]MBO1214066.1 hypothetical protein [Staphylococcus nepalensis]MBO1217440.1 hypothetical protein [Staphylococcus nepalensis]MBO1228250.1 hypothetical protein [Staphylococcus nepalensis]MBO1233783.1 hypothetical protein [Staphylococcus nepalensis]MBO1236527.1 hypothetical protein [Staphylococcus nepalensis]